jgi:acetylornithine/succinyldiaminopimelate/putrescine aminotransferase
LLLAGGGSPAAALTAGDVLDRMSTAEQTAYTFGSMEMAAFLAHAAGNAARGRCIIDWYGKGGQAQIIGALASFRQEQAQPVIHTLIKRACGE